jgi:hypothetical protein
MILSWNLRQTWNIYLFFFQGTPHERGMVSSTNKSGRHDMTERVLKVAFNTIALTLTYLQNK